MKDPEFRDNPRNPAYNEDRPEIERYVQLHSADQPDVHDVIAELRRVIDGYKDRVLIGEIYLPLERLVAYYGTDLSGTHLPFNFQLLQAPWNAHEIARIVQEYEAALPPGGWPNWVLGNHDKPRIAARVGEGQARIAAMLLLTLRGTPTMYYGDELGLGHVTISPDEVKDPWEKNEPGLGAGRDPQRTPMQWSAGPNAGFTTAHPWLPLSPDYGMRNVEALQRDPGSILTLYRRLIALRRRHPEIVWGEYEPVLTKDHVFAFGRRRGNSRLLTVLNMGHAPARVTLTAGDGMRVLLSSHLDRDDEPVGGEIDLRPDEGLILEPGPGYRPMSN